MNSLAINVTDADFEAQVVERSREIPVVVDLWAPWCGPCRQLTPILERIATRRRGEFVFVKINIDENPQVAAALGARSIPLVIGFRDGEAVSKFLGLQPEAAVNQFINSLVPTEADRIVAAAISAGADQEASLLRALALDPRHERAILALARLQASAGRYKDALATLARFPSTGTDEAATLIAEYKLKDAADVDVTALQARIDGAPGDFGAMIALGKAKAAAGEFEPALELLMQAVKGDPKFDNGAARQALIDLFKVMGSAHPLTREYRSRLATLLF